MGTTTSSNLTATIPDMTDAANVQVAFTNYHVNVAAAIEARANLSGASFTGAISSTGVITSTATSSNTAVSLVGQATSAINGCVYYGSTAANFDATNTAIGNTRKIIVSQNQPNTSTLAVGDIWIDF